MTGPTARDEQVARFWKDGKKPTALSDEDEAMIRESLDLTKPLDVIMARILVTLDEARAALAAARSEAPGKLDAETLKWDLLQLPQFQDRNPALPKSADEAKSRLDAMETEAFVAAGVLVARLREARS